MGEFCASQLIVEIGAPSLHKSRLFWKHRGWTWSAMWALSGAAVGDCGLCPAMPRVHIEGALMAHLGRIFFLYQQQENLWESAEKKNKVHCVKLIYLSEFWSVHLSQQNSSCMVVNSHWKYPIWAKRPRPCPLSPSDNAALLCTVRICFSGNNFLFYYVNLSLGEGYMCFFRVSTTSCQLYCNTGYFIFFNKLWNYQQR